VAARVHRNPRHRFIPYRVWRITPESAGWLLPLDRADSPEEWLRIVYADAPMDTQVDNGADTDRG
jgi:protein-L-isoaspartate(D-aspartate) O-methyltransferase